MRRMPVARDRGAARWWTVGVGLWLALPTAEAEAAEVGPGGEVVGCFTPADLSAFDARSPLKIQHDLSPRGDDPISVVRVEPSLELANLNAIFDRKAQSSAEDPRPVDRLQLHTRYRMFLPAEPTSEEPPFASDPHPGGVSWSSRGRAGRFSYLRDRATLATFDADTSRLMVAECKVEGVLPDKLHVVSLPPTDQPAAALLWLLPPDAALPPWRVVVDEGGGCWVDPVLGAPTGAKGAEPSAQELTSLRGLPVGARFAWDPAVGLVAALLNEVQVPDASGNRVPRTVLHIELAAVGGQHGCSLQTGDGEEARLSNSVPPGAPREGLVTLAAIGGEELLLVWRRPGDRSAPWQALVVDSGWVAAQARDRGPALPAPEVDGVWLGGLWFEPWSGREAHLRFRPGPGYPATAYVHAGRDLANRDHSGISIQHGGLKLVQLQYLKCRESVECGVGDVVASPRQDLVGPARWVLILSPLDFLFSPLALLLGAGWAVSVLAAQRATAQRIALFAQNGLGFDESSRHGGAWWGRSRKVLMLAKRLSTGQSCVLGGAKRTGKSLLCEGLAAGWLADLGSYDNVVRWPVPPRVRTWLAMPERLLARLGLVRARVCIPIRVSFRSLDSEAASWRRLVVELRAVTERLAQERTVLRQVRAAIGGLPPPPAPRARPEEMYGHWEEVCRTLQQHRVRLVVIVEEVSAVLPLGQATPSSAPSPAWEVLERARQAGASLLLEGARCERDTVLQAWVRRHGVHLDHLDVPLEWYGFTVWFPWMTGFFGLLGHFSAVRPTLLQRYHLFRACRGQPYVLQRVCAHVLGNRRINPDSDGLSFERRVDKEVSAALRFLVKNADWDAEDLKTWNFPQDIDDPPPAAAS